MASSVKMSKPIDISRTILAMCDAKREVFQLYCKTKQGANAADLLPFLFLTNDDFLSVSMLTSNDWFAYGSMKEQEYERFKSLRAGALNEEVFTQWAKPRKELTHSLYVKMRSSEIAYAELDGNEE
jgi:hypothetical protein